MANFLPEAVRKGLEEAQKAALKRSNRLCIHVGDDVYRVNRLWDGGFSMAAKDAPKIRGHVQIYDGPRHLYQALVVASRDEEEERVFEYKWHQAALDRPAADFAMKQDMPAGLLTHRLP